MVSSKIPNSNQALLVGVHGQVTGAMIIGSGIPAGPPREHVKFVHRFLKDVLDRNNRVRFPCGQPFFTYIRNQYGFYLEDGSQQDQLGGRHLFFTVAPVYHTEVIADAGGIDERVRYLWKVLLRAKTKGTQRRPRPHMTVSAATGLTWEEEHYKYNYVGLPVPKNLPEGDPGKDYWANTCHFDFGGFLPALPPAF